MEKVTAAGCSPGSRGGDAAMTETPDERPRPTPAPPARRPAPGPTPRARVAGSRRDRDDDAPATERTPRTTGRTRPRPAHRRGRPAPRPAPRAPRPRRRPPGRAARRAGDARGAAVPRARRRRPLGARRSWLLAVLCLLAAAGGSACLAAAAPALRRPRRSSPRPAASVQALYAFDYKDADASIKRKLAVLTGDLRDQYKKDLSQGGIIDTYKQVSATTELRRPRRRPAADQRRPGLRDAGRLRAVRGEVGEQRRRSRPRRGRSARRRRDGAPVVHADRPGARDQGRRRLEDQRPHAAHHELNEAPCVRTHPSPSASEKDVRGVAVPLRPRAGIMCRARSGSPCSPAAASFPGCGAVASAPPTWTAAREQG